MNIYSFSMLIIFLASTGIGVFSLLKSKRAPLARVFCLVLFSTAIWSGFLFLLYEYARTENQALIYSRSAHIGAIFVPIFFLHFTLVFLEKLKKRKLILISAYLYGLTFLFIVPTELFIRGMVLKFDAFSPLPGFLYFLYIFLYIFLVLYSSFQFIGAYKYTSGRKRSQIKYLLLAILFGFGGGVAAFLRPFVTIPPVHGFFVPLYAIMITYAILKYRLMEITVIIRKGIIYSFLALFIMGLYVLGIFFGQQFFQNILGVSPWLMGLLGTIIIVIGFRPLENLVAKSTDKIFFKARYNYQKTLNESSQAIASIINLDELLKLLFETLTKTVKVKQPRLFLFDPPSGQFIERSPEFSEKGETIALKIVGDSPLVLFLKKQKTLVTLEEVIYRISTVSFKKQNLEELENVKTQLEKIGSALVIPLIFKEELVGILSLGPKLSGEDFNDTDLRLLSTLVNQATVAIKNAELVERLQQSRKELQERIGELEKFYRLTVGRELRMAELKKEIKELKQRLKE